MGQKISLDEVEYDIDQLSDHGRATLASLQFATTHMQELTNMKALLQRAKNSYVDSIKKEILSDKAGFLLTDD